MTGAEVALIGEDVRAQLDVTLRQAESLKAAAATLTITNPTEQQLATEFVARAAQIKRANEKARKAEVGPLNAKVTAINAAFKEPVALLDEADQIVRRALTARMAEQERLRREAEERAAAERARAEAEAEAERRRLEEEAARQRRDAEEAERQRVAALRDELSQQFAALPDDELAYAVGDGRDALTPEVREAADRESAARAAARRAADEAQAAADAARVAELQVQTEIAPVAAPGGPSRATSGSSSLTKNWKFEIDDLRTAVQAWLEGKLPADFIQADEVAIGKYIRAAKGNHEQHPGITYKQVDGLSVRTSG